MSTIKSRFINTLCSNCSRNYGVPEFREHILDENTLVCRTCGQTYNIKGSGKEGYAILELVRRGREGRNRI